jgi:outer membrane protein TolC
VLNLESTIVMRLFRGLLVCAALSAFATPAFPQTGTPAPVTPPAAPAPAQAPVTRSLTVDDAVRLALENNLGLQVTRMNPQIEDLNQVLARAAWIPALSSTLQQNSTETPNSGFLSGAQGSQSTITGRFSSNVSVQQTLPWGGGNYSVGWDSSRSTSTSVFSAFSPQLQSSLSLAFTQPLLRNFGIDSTREQVEISSKNREIADVQVRQSVAVTSRTVRNAYWNLAYDTAALQVAQQSLDLAQQSLRDTQARVNIGTTPPIDIVQAQAEVAARQEAVIVAQAQIEQDQDTMRSLIYNPSTPDFWNIRIQPGQLPAFQPTPVDVNAAVNNALERRTDLQQAKTSLESTAITLRYMHNQTLPDVTLSLNYGLTGLGGAPVQNSGGGIFGGGTPTDLTARGFGSVLADLLGNDFPTWTAAVNIKYPVGTSPQDASLARERLQYEQAQTQLRNQELQVVTQVRQFARQVQTNQQRVQTTQAARELAERSLDAEQRKLAAGTSTNYQVFQAQRDLAQARTNEIRAILDYQESVVDFETVQEVPLNAAPTSVGGAVPTGTAPVSTASTTTSSAGATGGVPTGAQ